MAPRTVYANLGDGFQPFTLWDQSLADMGALGIIPCTAAGTNAITLTQLGTVFSPNVTVPNALQLFSFLATATSTAAVTIQIGSSGALKYYVDGVTQAGAGSVQSGLPYFVMYNAALNSGAGGFQAFAAGSSTATVDQNITAAGPATVANNSSVVRVNQTVGAPITLNLPAASSKSCPVLIADWKGDAGTNNITITPNGAEKIQGLSNWTIAADNASIFLRPIAGVGYAI
jgi:hypothetical protein